MPGYSLLRRWNLSLNVRDCDFFLVSLYLRFACLHFFKLFVMLAGLHFPMSHFLIIVNDSVSGRPQLM